MLQAGKERESERPRFRKGPLKPVEFTVAAPIKTRSELAEISTIHSAAAKCGFPPYETDVRAAAV